MSSVASRHRKSPYPMVEVNDAIATILQECTPTVETELVPFDDALHRVLAEDVVAEEPVPPFRASIKDGYAVRTADGIGERKVRDAMAAGDDPKSSVLKQGEAIRISTGAAIPPGADAVVQVEDTTLVKVTEDGKEEIVRIDVVPKLGQDIREIGSDIEQGAVVFERYERLTGFHLGVLATLGKTQVKVFRRPSVAVVSTGNELKGAHEKLKPGQIRDSNKLTLLHLLKRYSYDAVDCGIAKDDPESVKSILEKALSSCDVVVTSGGVSMGEHDVIKQVLLKDFEAMIHFGRVNMKPGKPTTFATLLYDGRLKVVFGLPGNPASCSVTCLLFVIPTLRFLERNKEYNFPRTTVEFREAKENSDDRPEYVRVSVSIKNGGLIAHSTGNQISSRLNSMVGANALLIFPGSHRPMLGRHRMHSHSHINCLDPCKNEEHYREEIRYHKYTVILFDELH